jgi:hypothetical protein
MNLSINRTSFEAYGIFGVMMNEAGERLACTLEHSFNNLPKVASGTYTCFRHAPNHLPYETFMLDNVPPFQGELVDGILIHIGNFNEDSDGCILLGQNRMGDMITLSRMTFEKFMALMSGVDSFQLTIS